ncbi:MAG TPA: class E sortase [Gaiellaceae bacterium]|nr:class E sortase [Gaiellaceae bacterium]
MRRQPEASRSRRGGLRGRPAGRLRRALSAALIAAGVLTVAWVLVAWRWQDPVTAIETWRHQAALGMQLRNRSVPERSRPVRLEARAYRLASHQGEAMGRILIPRLGLDAVLVEGTTEPDLAKGPGIYAGDFLPGEGRLVYVAGHRTTYSAPFAQINLLRRGDRITIRMPYGTFRYVVTRHRIVPATDVAVLRSGHRELLILQSCHPRFYATHRYLVYARPLRRTP